MANGIDARPGAHQYGGACLGRLARADRTGVDRMSNLTVKPAVLDEQQVNRVKQIEREIGDDSVVIAYAKTREPAELTPSQLDRLRDVERELGVYLVAWRKPA